MRRLSLHQRLNITIDVASALHYLHHECEQLIIHCDIKPSNVLLNDSMVAHVSDFGISRLLSTLNHTISGQWNKGYSWLCSSGYCFQFLIIIVSLNFHFVFVYLLFIDSILRL